MSRKISRKAQQRVKKLNVWSNISQIAGFVLSFAGLFTSVILFAIPTLLVPSIITIVASIVVAVAGIVGSVVLEDKAKKAAEYDLANNNYEVQTLEKDQTNTNTVEKEQPKVFVEQTHRDEKEISKDL